MSFVPSVPSAIFAPVTELSASLPAPIAPSAMSAAVTVPSAISPPPKPRASLPAVIEPSGVACRIRTAAAERSRSVSERSLIWAPRTVPLRMSAPLISLRACAGPSRARKSASSAMSMAAEGRRTLSTVRALDAASRPVGGRSMVASPSDA